MTEQLLLPSFSIRGYRGFEALDIERLGRVNLLVGRNAVGKTSVLEAIELWASDLGESTRRLAQILVERQEIELSPALSKQGGGINWVRAFHGGQRWDADRIRLALSEARQAALFFEQHYGRWQTAEDGTRRFGLANRPSDVPNERVISEPTILAARLFEDGQKPMTFYHSLQQTMHGSIEQRPPCERLQARGMRLGIAPKLWDRALLEGTDAHILDAMRLIIPDLERLTFVEAPRPSVSEDSDSLTSSRIPVVRREGRGAEPLRAFGDGVIRLLDLTLALVSVQGGILLVDEIENGVHYSVLPDLWRLVFAVAAKLDIQVIAATHSWDCIEAFQKAATEHPADGMLVRLERDDHGTRAALFTEDDLETVTAAGIEVR